METSYYAVESEIEATHWWFIARRKLLTRIINKLNVLPDDPLLDVGTSTGANLRLLKNLGFRNVTGVDNSDAAIYFCKGKGLNEVQKGDICNLPFASKKFKLILATDIIEHVDNDLDALLELKRILSPDGLIIITVPAFQSLWGLQDRVAHHKRRYRLKQLRHLLQQAGFDCQESFYFNYLLFIPIWLTRKLINIFNIRLDNESQVNTPLLNHILLAIFSFDVATAGFIRPPFGVSILAIVKSL